MKVSVYKRAEIKEARELTDGEVFIMDNYAYLMLSDSGFSENLESDEYPIVDLHHGFFLTIKGNQEVIVPERAELIVDVLHCDPNKITDEV